MTSAAVDARTIPLDAVEEAIASLFVACGMPPADAAILAGRIADAEWQGVPSHGLARLPGYLGSMRSGWVNVRAEPKISAPAPAILAVDADNGFAQIALDRAADRLIEAARTCGLAMMFVRRSHHLAALYPDVELFARRGWVALAFVNTRKLMVAPGGTRKVLGTNPMAFAFPRPGGRVVSWDQAASTIAHGEVIRAARDGRPLPEGAGVDASGRPSTDAQAVLEGGVSPFAGAKGYNIALMVELLVGAVGGARFGFEDLSASFPGAGTSEAGEAILLLSPDLIDADAFIRAEAVFRELEADGTVRLPGSRRKAPERRAGATLVLSAEQVALLAPHLPSRDNENRPQ